MLIHSYHTPESLISCAHNISRACRTQAAVEKRRSSAALQDASAAFGPATRHVLECGSALPLLDPRNITGRAQSEGITQGLTHELQIIQPERP